MAEATTSTGHQDPLWRMRWMLLASMIAVLFGTAVLVSVHHADWSWPLFVWGFAVGVAALAIVALIGIAARREATTEDQRLRIRRRLIIYTFCWIAACLICGTISATFDQVWIDILVTVYVVLIFSAAVLIVVRRRRSLK